MELHGIQILFSFLYDVCSAGCIAGGSLLLARYYLTR